MEKYTYEVIKSDFGTMIKRSDGAFIPEDPANSDYQAYLNPVEHLTEIAPQAAISDAYKL